jgi:hypothetical protein
MFELLAKELKKKLKQRHCEEKRSILNKCLANLSAIYENEENYKLAIEQLNKIEISEMKQIYDKIAYLKQKLKCEALKDQVR